VVQKGGIKREKRLKKEKSPEGVKPSGLDFQEFFKFGLDE